MATVNKPILLDETGKAIVSALQAQTEALKNVSIAGNPADYIVDCEYTEGEVTLASGETITAVTSWYERYASGKVRQGGLCTEANEHTTNVTFSIPMTDILYKATIESYVNPFDVPNVYFLDGRETTGFLCGVSSLMGTASALPWVWIVEGMGANL